MSRYPFTDECLRKKKRFAGDLRSFMRRHNLSNQEAAHIIKAVSSNVGSWLRGDTTVTLKLSHDYRERMKAYDEAHPTNEPEQIQAQLHDPEIRNEQGIGLKMSGPNFSFESVVTMQQAASIISLVSQQ